MATVTVTFQDNALTGQPGQSDVIMTVASCEPSMPLPDERNIDTLTSAQAAAIAAVAHVAGMGYSAAWLLLHEGVEQ